MLKVGNVFIDIMTVRREDGRDRIGLFSHLLVIQICATFTASNRCHAATPLRASVYIIAYLQIVQIGTLRISSNDATITLNIQLISLDRTEAQWQPGASSH